MQTRIATQIAGDRVGLRLFPFFVTVKHPNYCHRPSDWACDPAVYNGCVLRFQVQRMHKVQSAVCIFLHVFNFQMAQIIMHSASNDVMTVPNK
jgi:hypothetical protein